MKILPLLSVWDLPQQAWEAVFPPEEGDDNPLLGRCDVDCFTLTMGFGTVLSIVAFAISFFFFFPVIFTASFFLLGVVCAVGTWCAYQSQQLETMSGLLDEFEEENNQLKNTRIGLQQEVDRLQDQTGRLEEHICALKNEHEEQKKTLNEHTNRLEEQLDDFQNLSEKNTQEYAKLKKTREDLDKIKVEIAITCAELKVYKEELVDVKRQMDSVVQEMRNETDAHKDLLGHQKDLWVLLSPKQGSRDSRDHC